MASINNNPISNGIYYLYISLFRTVFRREKPNRLLCKNTNFGWCFFVALLCNKTSNPTQ